MAVTYKILLPGRIDDAVIKTAGQDAQVEADENEANIETVIRDMRTGEIAVEVRATPSNGRPVSKTLTYHN